MAKKRIGELLLENGAITSSQLARALRDQQILGGHLGTCLIELGFVEEDVLGEALADLLNARYACWSDLIDVPPDVIRLISPEQAKKYSVIPLRIEDNALHVAAIAARTLTALSSATKRRIVPWVSPEIRLLQAMELHYDIPMTPRYIKLGQELERKATEAQSLMSSGQTLQRSDGPEPNVYESTDEDLNLCKEYGYGRNWQDIAAESATDEKAPSNEARAIEVVDESGDREAVPASMLSATADLETIHLAQSLMRGHISLAHGLRQLGFLRSDHDLWGEFAVCVASRLLKLALFDEGERRGIDGRDASGCTFQISATSFVPGNGCILPVRTCDVEADYFVGISVLPSLEVVDLIRMPYRVARSLADMTPKGLRLTWDASTADCDSVEKLDPTGDPLVVLPDHDVHFQPSAVED